MTFCTTLV
jgi:hypothetical protein